MRARIWAAALLMGAAACGNAATNPAVDGGGTGLPIGRGQAGGTSTINPTVALANSVARDCPQRCVFRIGNKAGEPQTRGAYAITEDASVLMTGWDQPIRWTLATGSKLLPLPEGASYAGATAQNGWGQLVGNTYGPSTAPVAWEPDGTPIVLSDRPYGQPLDGKANSINDNSVIVGVASNRAFRTQYQEGFRWLAGPGSTANDVNFKGQVVGRAPVGQWWQATLWAPDGTPTSLGIFPGYQSSEAVAISETGIVVGINTVNFTKKGFIWTAADGMKELPENLIPRDVNHWGEVVGTLGETADCAVYYKGYGVLRLPRLNDTSAGCTATSINSWGDVAGEDAIVGANGRLAVTPVVWTWGGNEGRYGF